ncbi:unnamed protein product [Amoebophrya sp. A25]|nr:unnamed protein product [Amoebophrya sp. A25]|eukprot:GSA25T00004817001.1
MVEKKKAARNKAGGEQAQVLNANMQEASSTSPKQEGSSGATMSAASTTTTTSSASTSGNFFTNKILTPDFFQKTWEKEPKFWKRGELGGENFFPDYFTVDRFVKMISPDVRCYKNDDPNVPSSGDPVRAYLSGCSLVHNQADRLDAKLLQFCQQLGSSFFAHVFCVYYLTPPEAQAVRAHSDDQDVFVLQVWGKKTWRLWAADPLLIYTEEMLGKQEPIPREKYMTSERYLQTVTVEAGDVLYLPRGVIHEAETGEESSLHFTITVPSCDYCWAALLSHYLDQKRPSLAGEKSLPLEVDNFLLTGDTERDEELLAAPACTNTISAMIYAEDDEDVIQHGRPSKFSQSEISKARIREQFDKPLQHWVTQISENFSLQEVLDAYSAKMNRINSEQQEKASQILGNAISTSSCTVEYAAEKDKSAVAAVDQCTPSTSSSSSTATSSKKKRNKQNKQPAELSTGTDSSGTSGTSTSASTSGTTGQSSCCAAGTCSSARPTSPTSPQQQLYPYVNPRIPDTLFSELRIKFTPGIRFRRVQGTTVQFERVGTDQTMTMDVQPQAVTLLEQIYSHTGNSSKKICDLDDNGEEFEKFCILQIFIQKQCLVLA